METMQSWHALFALSFVVTVVLLHVLRRALPALPLPVSLAFVFLLVKSFGTPFVGTLVSRQVFV